MTITSALRLLRAPVIIGAVGALGLVEPRPLGPWARAAYRVSTAAVGGLLVADTTSEDASLLSPALDGILTGGLALGLMDLSEALDGRIVDALQGLGVHRPRLLLAAAGAVGAVAVYLLPAVTGTEERWTTAEEILGEPEVAELPEGVRALLAALLEAPADGEDLPGAPALREQLDTAVHLRYGGSSSDVQLIVEEPKRLAVPRNQTWPVTGSFEQAGFTFQLELQIDAGMLGMLSIMVQDEEEHVEGAFAHLDDPRFTLPSREQLTVHRESETP